MLDDTHPRARAHLTAMYQRLTLSQRAAMGMQMSTDARLLALEAIRQRHPEYSEDDARLALGRLWLGDELFRKVKPDAPLLDP
ncbi:MAG: hypothetical protein R3F60_00795 [bacterium]